MRRLVVVSAAMLWAGTSSAAASTITVTPNTADSNASCSASPCANLRSAVGYANTHAGTTLSLAKGMYKLSLGELLLSADATIIGKGSGSTEIQQTDGIDRVLHIGSGAHVTLQNLEVTGGHLGPAGSGSANPQDAHGGGILDDAYLTLNGVLVDQNSAVGGDGASSSTGAGTDGAGAAGGGIYENAPASALVVENSEVTDNTASGGTGGDSTANTGDTPGGGGGTANGGGVAAENIQVSDTTFARNVASGGDGGMSASGGVFGGENGEAGGGSGTGGGLAAVNAGVARDTFSANVAVGGLGGSNSFDSSKDGFGGSGSGGGLATAAPSYVINSTVNGNTATGQGQGGEGAGGGIEWATGPTTATAGLYSDTIVGNSVSNDASTVAAGGNVVVTGQMTLQDTIVAGGTSSTTTAPVGNCFIGSGAAISDGGYNLEDQSGPCGLTAATDLTVADAKLGPLADNGGPTQTIALDPASPAIGAGGQCVDAGNNVPPLRPFAPLTVDQRGFPRHATCDIGAFEHQDVTNTAPPTITGTATVGQTLTCNPGSWSAADVTYAYQWLSDGTPIQGATDATYVAQPSDAGHQLACSVTASDTSGSGSATSAPVTVNAGGSGGTGGTGGSGGTGGTGGAGGTQTPGKVSIPAQTIKIGAHGAARVKLKCAGQTRCTGALRITVTRLADGAYIATVAKKHGVVFGSRPGRRHHHKPEVIVLAHVTFSIAPNKITKVAVTVVTFGRELVKENRHVGATVRVAASGAKKPIKRVVKLT